MRSPAQLPWNNLVVSDDGATSQGDNGSGPEETPAATEQPADEAPGNDEAASSDEDATAGGPQEDEPSG